MKLAFFLKLLLPKIVFGLLIFYLINVAQLDGFIWTENGRLFLEALKEGNLAKTYIGPDLFHPGISVIWITAIVNFLFGWMNMDYLIVVQRAVFITIFTVLAFLSYKLWIKRWPAKIFYLTVGYILCSPFSLLWGTVTWLDSLLLSLTLPIILFWLSFLESKKNSYLILVGVLIGLSVLTKYIGADRLAMIAGITIWYSLQKKVSFKQFIFPLIQVCLIVFLTFAFLYPAFWLDPQFVLFDRYNTSRSYQAISYTHISSTVDIYLKYLTRIDLLIALGGIITIYQLVKKSSNSLLYIAIGGLIHFSFLIAAIIFLNDIRRGSEAFISSIGRYQISAVILIAPIYFSFIYNQKIKSLAIYFFLLLPFIIELYFVYRIQTYPWLT